MIGGKKLTVSLMLELEQLPRSSFSGSYMI